MSCVSVGRARLFIAFVLWLAPAVASADSVTLAWDPSTGATGYTVRWGTAMGSYPNSGDAGNNTTFVINGLTAGATYWTVVQAYNSSGTSPYSVPLQFTVPPSTVPCSYSTSPASVSVADTASSGTITVTTQSGCVWSATSASSFLTFQNATGRTGPGSVTFLVAANTATSPRTGTATVAGQPFSVSQAAAPAPCTYSISPASVSVADTASTGTITVTTQSGCAWSAATSSNFLSFTNGSGRTGSGSVTFAVAANTATTARTATATVAGQPFSVSQAAAPAPCTYSISPGAASVSDAASTGTITVTTQTSCTWDATSSSSFLSFQNGTGRTGSGTVTYAVTANTSTSTRIGTAMVAGTAFSVSQAAAPAPCTYSINPASANVSDLGGNGTIDVTTQTGCAWDATSASGFLTFSNGSGRTGSGSVTFTVAPNTATTARTGSATVAGNAFSVSQAAAPPPQACTYSISPANTAVGASAGTATVTVTTQAGCAWSATSASSFLTFSNGTGRSGPGTVAFAFTANTGALRTGQGTIAGAAFSIRQAAPGGCSYAINPDRTTVPYTSNTGTIDVTTQAGCTWTATSVSTFITIANGSGRSGPGSVDFTVAANTSTASRLGLASVASTTLYVTQQAAPVNAPPPPSTGPSPWSSDFDNDGKNDVLLQDPVSGGVEAWFLDNATLKGRQSLSDNNGPDWVLVGRGDFNSDGKPDLVWHNKSDFTIEIWYMDGTIKLQSVNPSSPAPNDPLWHIAGVGDFNRDGKPDLVWQHFGDGSLAVWMMNGATVTQAVSVVPNGTSDLLWKVVGVGDFNGDGSSDLVWRHMGRGDVAVWTMNGVSRIVHTPTSPFSVPDQGWQIGAVTDANGDGKPDLVWEHTDGTIMIWHMNGTQRVTYPIVPATVPSGWHIVGPK